MTDSDLLGNFGAAIVTAFAALTGGVHNAFYTAVGGRLYMRRAPQGTSLPYSTYFVVAQHPERTFTEDYRDLLVQFSHFAVDSSAAETIAAACNDLFDDTAPFTITGATLVWMRLANGPSAQPEDVAVQSGGSIVWECVAEYDVLISMN